MVADSILIKQKIILSFDSLEVNKYFVYWKGKFWKWKIIYISIFGEFIFILHSELIIVWKMSFKVSDVLLSNISSDLPELELQPSDLELLERDLSPPMTHIKLPVFSPPLSPPLTPSEARTFACSQQKTSQQWPVMVTAKQERIQSPSPIILPLASSSCSGSSSPFSLPTSDHFLPLTPPSTTEKKFPNSSFTWFLFSRNFLLIWTYFHSFRFGIFI